MLWGGGWFQYKLGRGGRKEGREEGIKRGKEKDGNKDKGRKKDKNRGKVGKKKGNGEAKKDDLDITILGRFFKSGREGFQNRWNNIHPWNSVYSFWCEKA